MTMKQKIRLLDTKKIILVALGSGIVIIILQFVHFGLLWEETLCKGTLWSDTLNEFDDFNNVTGTNLLIVPNYVHFLRFGWWMEELLFFDAVCILAAFKNQKPDKIYFHSDLNNFSGKYWDIVVSTPGILDVIEFVPVDIPEDIFGQKFTVPENEFFHISDILRIEVLMKYGGIYLDGDTYIVRSLDNFRRYEMAVGWDEGELLGSQILVAHKDARFLRHWLNSYRDNYRADMWYFNAGEHPTRSILEIRPELVHRVRLLFGVQDLRGKLYHGMWSDWTKQYAIHVLSRHVDIIKDYYYSDISGPEDLNDTNLQGFAFTMRFMVEDVLSLPLRSKSLEDGDST